VQNIYCSTRMYIIHMPCI